jgi:hypothetical protein
MGTFPNLTFRMALESSEGGRSQELPGPHHQLPSTIHDVPQEILTCETETLKMAQMTSPLQNDV